MKITLEFDGLEEQDDLQTALDGYKWKIAMWELDQQLRKITKYGASMLSSTDPATSQEMEVADAVRESLREILNEYNLKLD
jgi:hypothetical protein